METLNDIDLPAKLVDVIMECITSSSLRLVWNRVMTEEIILIWSWIAEIRATNMALMSKLGWRLLREPDAVWSTVLISMYGRKRRELKIFREKPNSMGIWRGLIWSSHLQAQGTRCAVGNGKLI